MKVVIKYKPTASKEIFTRRQEFSTSLKAYFYIKGMKGEFVDSKINSKTADIYIRKVYEQQIESLEFRIFYTD